MMPFRMKFIYFMTFACIVAPAVSNVTNENGSTYSPEQFEPLRKNLNLSPSEMNFLLSSKRTARNEEINFSPNGESSTPAGKVSISQLGINSSNFVHEVSELFSNIEAIKNGNGTAVNRMPISSQTVLEGGGQVPLGMKENGSSQTVLEGGGQVHLGIKENGLPSEEIKLEKKPVKARKGARYPEENTTVIALPGRQIKKQMLNDTVGLPDIVHETPEPQSGSSTQSVAARKGADFLMKSYNSTEKIVSKPENRNDTDMKGSSNITNSSEELTQIFKSEVVTKPTETTKSKETVSSVNTTNEHELTNSTITLPVTHNLPNKSSISKPYTIDTDDSSSESTISAIDYIIPVVGLVFSLPLIVVLVMLFYKKGSEFWERRHYRRMDFLIDGMYND